MTEKLNNISDYCVFLAYPELHSSDMYSVLDLKTKNKTLMVALMQSGPNRYMGNFRKQSKTIGSN